jgi:hypothetical protein
MVGLGVPVAAGVADGARVDGGVDADSVAVSVSDGVATATSPGTPPELRSVPPATANPTQQMTARNDTPAAASAR